MAAAVIIYFIFESTARGTAFNILHTASVIYIGEMKEGKTDSDALISVAQALGPQTGRLVFVDHPAGSHDKTDVIFILNQNSWRDRSGVAERSGRIRLSTRSSVPLFDATENVGARMIASDSWNARDVNREDTDTN